MRIVILGAGHLGRIHARLLRARKDAELVGVADPDPHARRLVASELGVPTSETIAAMGDDYDAAVVATPTLTHHAMGMELLRRGKHVFMEKPLAATTRDADELVEEAARRNLVLQVGHIERFNPAWTAVADTLSNIRYVDAARLSGYTFRSTDVGVVLDMMVHDLDLILSALRLPVVRVDACGISVLGRHEDAVNARLVFADGCVANLSASRVSYKSQRRMHLWTPECFVRLDFTVHTVMRVRPREDVARREFDESKLTLAQKSYLREKLFTDLLPIQHLATEQRNAMVDEHDDFLESIRTGREPRVAPWQAREVVAMAERIQQAVAASGGVPAADPAPITLPLPTPTEAPPARREAG